MDELVKDMDYIVHFAAESHVDRSIEDPQIFIKTNIIGTQVLLDAAKKHGIISIKGHRAVGGMRASIYNAMTLEGVKALVEFMKEFEKEHLK